MVAEDGDVELNIEPIPAWASLSLSSILYSPLPTLSILSDGAGETSTGRNPPSAPVSVLGSRTRGRSSFLLNYFVR